jgi:hypothetical protein
MEQIIAYKTKDGKIFDSQEEARKYEKEVYDFKIFKLKEEYVREKLKQSVYGKLFVNEFEPRKSNITPDMPLVHVLIKDSDMVREMLNHLETIK